MDAICKTIIDNTQYIASVNVPDVANERDVQGPLTATVGSATPNDFVPQAPVEEDPEQTEASNK